MIRIVEITTSTNYFPLNLIEYVRLVQHSYCVCSILVQFPPMSRKEKSIQLKCTFTYKLLITIV
jgi:hypothetical protein